MPRQALPALLLPLLALACSPQARLVESWDDALPAEGFDTLEVEVGTGDLFIEGLEDLEEIQVEVRVMTHRTSCEHDEDALDGLRYRLEEQADGSAHLQVELDAEHIGYSADVTVYAPARLALQVDDSSGDLTVRSFASLELEDGNGDTDIEQIAADARITDGTGDLRVIGVGGELILDDGNGDLEIRDVAGPVLLEDGGGDLRLESVAADVEIEDGNGDLDVYGVIGDLRIRDGSGDIAVREVTGTVTIHDGNGDIRVEDVGDLDVQESGSGDIVWD